MSKKPTKGERQLNIIEPHDPYKIGKHELWLMRRVVIFDELKAAFAEKVDDIVAAHRQEHIKDWLKRFELYPQLLSVDYKADLLQKQFESVHKTTHFTTENIQWVLHTRPMDQHKKGTRWVTYAMTLSEWSFYVENQGEG